SSSSASAPSRCSTRPCAGSTSTCARSCAGDTQGSGRSEPLAQQAQLVARREQLLAQRVRLPPHVREVLLVGELRDGLGLLGHLHHPLVERVQGANELRVLLRRLGLGALGGELLHPLVELGGALAQLA